jgi:hypothetical protein
MRRVTLALGLSVALAAPSFAQLPSQLELVRGLRQAGLVDLAIQRLEELKSKPNLLTPEEAKIVPLELARIRLEEASREVEDSRRATLIGQARTSFEEFIKENPTHPAAAQANVEIAHLIALQAKGLLSRGNRQEGRDAKALEFSRARPEFTNAINRYKGAILNLDNRLKGLKDGDALAEDLKRSKAQAELDAAVLRYELALTYIGEDETRQRGEELDKAAKEFDALVTKYANQRVGFLAQVWSAQCAFALGDPKGVANIQTFVNANRQNRDAADAVRLGAYFGIEHTYEADPSKDTIPGGKFIRTEQAAQRWLQTYPEAKNTPEGLGARYRRGLMKESQAFLPGGVRFEDPKAAPKSKDEKERPAGPRKVIAISPQAKALLEDANKIYKELTETDNEYSDRAHRHRLSNQLVILEAEGKGGDTPLKSINTLEQAVLAAQVQQARIYDLTKSDKPAEEIDKEEKRRVKLATQYLERGLQKVDPKDTPRDVFDAQMLLCQFLTKDDRAVEAAVLGEGLARNNPKMSKASLAATLGVYAYNSSIGRVKKDGLGEDAESADLQRLKSLANFAIATWPNDGPTDAARHILGFYLSNKDEDYENAWKTYASIGSGYPDLAQARREQAAALFYLLRSKEKDPKKNREALQKNLTDRSREYQATITALDALPDPGPGSSGAAAESWAGARTMQAQLYYMAGDYDKVDATVKKVADVLGKLPTQDDKRRDALDEKKKEDLIHTARALKFNALQGKTADFLRAKEYAKVGEVLGKDLEALKKELKAPPPETESPGFSRLRKAQRDFLIASMAAYLQNKQADQAGELLDALQGAGGTVEQNVAVMQQLVAAIRTQMESLTKEGKKGEADELGRGFADFLDKIKAGPNLSKNVIVFLGQGYGAVDQHAKAVELFSGLLAKTDPDKDQGFYRQLEFLLARAHRQAGEFPKAAELMKKIVGEPTKKDVPHGWGWGNLAIRKEYCMLFEDQNQFGLAGEQWRRLQFDFIPVRGLPGQVKFLGSRPAFQTAGAALDAGLANNALMPTAVGAFLDTGFKSVFPSVAETRNRQRLVYFDIYYEQYRCAARSCTVPAIIARLPKKQETANERLTEYGQKFYELVSKNEDVPVEIREKIADLLDKHPLMKKRYDELAAAGPKP